MGFGQSRVGTIDGYTIKYSVKDKLTMWNELYMIKNEKMELMNLINKPDKRFHVGSCIFKGYL